MIYLNQGPLSSLYLRPESDTKARRVQRLLIGMAGEPEEIWLYPSAGNELASWNGGELVFDGRGVLYTNNTNANINQSFTVPAHVGRLHMVAIGAGGSGSASAFGGTGGGGGSLAALLNVPVHPGDIINLTVGAGGAGGLKHGSAGAGQPGGNTVISGFLTAGGGQGGANVADTSSNAAGGIGGIPSIDHPSLESFVSVFAGGGGKGGDYHDTNPNGSGSSNACGGGGAGGYGVGSDGSGAIGGAGGGANTGTSSGSGVNGAGGGGGSCGGNTDVTHGGRGGMGGGTGPFGKGADGAGVLAIAEPETDSNAFQLGNLGLSGSENSTYTGRIYGGGSGGMDTDSATPDEVTEAGQGGAILICWGPPVSV